MSIKDYIMQSISVLAMISALLCVVFFGSDFLIKHQKVLTLIDISLFEICFIDLIFVLLSGKKYYKFSINCFIGWCLFIWWERTDIVFELSDFYFKSGYYATLLFVIVKSILDNRQR